MLLSELRTNVIVRGPVLPEPVQVIRVVPVGASIKLVGRGLVTGMVHQPILSAAQLASLEASPETQPFDGDPRKFKLGVEALRLGIAYEYDPYFSLSIARVDPLPHQLEAVYDYFLKLPRIRFLLADDPGAGKTIMAGLLIKVFRNKSSKRPRPACANSICTTTSKPAWRLARPELRFSCLLWDRFAQTRAPTARQAAA